jgi:hypothetical protein
MDEKVLTAVVGGGASLVVTILGQIFNPFAQKRLEHYKTALQEQLETQKAQLQKRLEEHKAESQVQIEALKAHFSDRNSASAARRDYEYDARKRLYSEVEPLLFELYEAAEECYFRVLSLNRSAHQEHLGLGKDSWLSHDGYYLISTAYKLILPSTIFRLIRRRLTFVDLKLDEVIRLRYLLAKNLAHSFTDAFDFASLVPSLPYTPSWETEADSIENRSFKRHQGLISGDLENILDDLINSKDGSLVPMSLGEFQNLAKQSTSESHQRTLLDLYRGFSPATDPVLARMLVTQAILCRLFMSTFKGRGSLTGLKEELKALSSSPDVRQLLSWPGSDLNKGNDVDIVMPYLTDCLTWIESAP